MSALSSVRAVFILLAVSIAFLLPGPVDAQGTRVGAALLSFESAVSSNVVSAEWREIRPRWTQEVADLTSPVDLALFLLELESNMEWHSVSPEWRNRPPSWVQEVNGAMRESEVALLLLDLEGNTLWSAVDAKWRNIRPGWLAELHQIASGAEPAPPPAAKAP
jgi:protein gp37